MTHPTATDPQLPKPLHLLILVLLLGYLAVAPLAIAVFVALLPATFSPTAQTITALALLVGLLLAPAAVLAFGTRRKAIFPLTAILLGVTLYIVVDNAIRAVAGPSEASQISLLETILRLTILTLTALLLGAVGLWRVGLRTRPDLLQALGLSAPSLPALLLALASVAVLILGWPLTGALGDRWTIQLLLIQTLALVLPEELFFRGVLPGLLNGEWRMANRLFPIRHSPSVPGRVFVHSLILLLVYLAFIPSLILPHQAWGWLLFFSALPLAWLALELRYWSGNIWAGTLLIWLGRAAPILFSDPRDEFPLITQPWQTLARLWLFCAGIALVMLILVGRSWLGPRWRRSARATLGLAAVIALVGWSSWLAVWFTLGRPGFYDDGFLIIMAQQANLSGAEQIKDLAVRRAFVRLQLLKTANQSQAPVRQALEAAGLPYRPFYLINMIRVEGHHRRMPEFAHLPGVAKVMLNPNVRPYPLSAEIGYGDTPPEGQGIEWNLSQVQADQVWQMGYSGQGVVVAGQDTGYDWQHPALQGAYRGVDAAGQVDHNHNWRDAWDNSLAPFDDGQHGTHTMGTILGDDDQGNQIGMAPQARWLGCRNMRRGLGNPASYTDCMEFFLAPYPLNGDPFTQGDVTKAPQVVNNSWGCPDIEGCDDTVLQPALDALRAAGIMMVVSAGNEGPACSTVMEPPARYDSAFSVGATDKEGLITSFSSRGPVAEAAGTGQAPLLKPDIAAPGANIRSSIPGGNYGTADGTSMAGPHVAGLVALVWSANPQLIGQLEATEAIIRQSAIPNEASAACSLATNGSALSEFEGLENSTACACGGISGTPNNVYGWGEINALAALQLALAWQVED